MISQQQIQDDQLKQKEQLKFLQQLQQNQQLSIPLYIQTTQENIDKLTKEEDLDDLCVYQSSDLTGAQTSLPFVMALSGRGQDGLAGFFGDKEDQSLQFLIKVDDPATCVLEATARFAKRLIIPGHEKSVNFAQAGLLKVGDDVSVISVQDRVAASKDHKIVPWDTIVYGSKRNPKAWVSTESRNKKTIKQNIFKMTEKAQWDLANAVYISTVVGDESLHVGQFMAETDIQGVVTGITRIDFGARERYAANRYLNDDFRHETSSNYYWSGQAGKDYLKYLIDPSNGNSNFRVKYLSLWSRNTNLQAIADQHQRVFHQEMNKLGDTQREQALDDILKTIFKKSKKDYSVTQSLPLQQKQDKVAEILGNITYKRMLSMQKSARSELYNEVLDLFKQAGIQFNKHNRLKLARLMVRSDKDTANYLNQINRFLFKQATQCDPSKTVFFKKIAKRLITRQSLAEHTGIQQKYKQAIGESLQDLSRLHLRFKILEELNQYKDHLSLKVKKVDAKIECINSAIEKLQVKSSDEKGRFKYSPDQVIDEQFKQTISKRRVNPSSQTKSHGAQMIDRLEKIIDKYQLLQPDVQLDAAKGLSL